MNRPQLIIATGNPHKVDEMRDQLSPWFDVVGLPTGYQSPIEDGNTFAANALIKAQTAALRLNCLCLADDSGICVDYLDGAPGIYSARYAGEQCDDEANNDRLLAELSQVRGDQRKAHFVCALSLAAPTGELASFEGIFEGKVGYERKGQGGFGYDPIFVLPDGRTSAQLSASEKRQLSHRGKALLRMTESLDKSDLYRLCIAASSDV